LASLAQAIRNWVVQADRQEGRREEKDDGLSTTEREELARLRRENKQLRVKRDILVSLSDVCDGRRRHGAGELVIPLGFVLVPEIEPQRPSASRAEQYPGRRRAGQPDYKEGRREAGPSNRFGGSMDIVGIDISKAKFDAALLVGERIRHGAFSSTEAGFEQFLAWLARHRPDPAIPLHACMEATGNWGLDLAAFLHGRGVRVSVVNPARVKAYGASELARNKTDRLDAALTARFCRAHASSAWVPPAGALRELRELVRRCDALKAARAQEMNRRAAGFASPAVAASIKAHIDWLDEQIEAVMGEVRRLIASDPALSKNLALVRGVEPKGSPGITGFGEVSAVVLRAELPNIGEFTPKALAAFAGLSPSEHSSGASVRRPGKISRIGNQRLRSMLYMCALSAKRNNKVLADFVRRMAEAGKPPKVILVAVARKLLVYAHAVIRTQKPFQPFPEAPSSI